MNVKNTVLGKINVVLFCAINPLTHESVLACLNKTNREPPNSRWMAVMPISNQLGNGKHMQSTFSSNLVLL